MDLWSNRRVRYIACAAGVAAITIPIGIGVATTSSVASPTQVPTQSSPTSLRAQADVKKLSGARLLSSSQLGSNWKRVDLASLKRGAGKSLGTSAPADLKSMLGDIAVSPSSCSDLLSVPNSGAVTGVGVRVFKKGNAMFGPYAGQAVVRFSDDAAATAALEQARTVAAACSNVTVTTKYGTIDATVSPIAVPSVGSERVGYRLDANVAGFISVNAQLTAVRKGNKIVIVGQAGTTTSSSLTKKLTRKAFARA